VAIFAMLSAVLVGNLYAQYRKTLADTERVAVSLAQAFEEHTVRTFTRMDLLLADTILQIRPLPDAPSWDDAALGDALRQVVRRNHEANSLSLVDAAGIVRTTARRPQEVAPGPDPGSDLSQHDYFTSQRDDPSRGLAIGAPVPPSRLDHGYIPVTRRLEKAGGGFAGVMMIALDPAYFQGFYRSFHPGDGGSVSLVRDDGFLLAREPTIPHLVGKAVVQGPIFRQHLPKSPAGVVRTVAPTDGVDRTVAYRKVRELPLVILVGIATETALADWFDDVRNSLALWLAVLIAMLIATLFQRRVETARARAEEALQRSEKRARRDQVRLSDAIDSISEGFYLFDADDRLVLLNDVARRNMGDAAPIAIPGVTFEELLRAKIRTNAPNVSAADQAQMIGERLAQHRTPGSAPITRRLDQRWFRITERPMTESGVVVIESDITVIKRVEQRLTAAKDEAERANRTKSEFLAHMSHELRTPLNSILGFAEILGGEMFGALGDPRYREYAAFIHQSGTHLLQVINDILDLSKIEAGKMNIEMAPMDLGELIDRCVRLVQMRADRARVRVVTDSGSSAPPVIADETRIKQILFNLLSNAIKFTPVDGEIRVTARPAGAGWVEMIVADTGIGIAAADIEKALAPFAQIANAMVRSHEGAGLGLPLSKHLAELHGGSLDITSTPGKGTTVVVRLPAATVAPRLTKTAIGA
jgi:signal transduction histidine kinase